jgi:hypothetical protein
MDVGKGEERNPVEVEAWTSKFLVERIEIGDRVVLQTEQPLSSFLIGEVIEPGYDFAPGTLDDFNHLLHIKPLTPKPIPINARAVSVALKHDLSKRGRYYEIYPEESLRELDEIVCKIRMDKVDLNSVRSDDNTLDETFEAARQSLIQTISRAWPAKHFERFCEHICKQLDFVEVKERSDVGRGWDMLVRIVNPITGNILLDDVPVQCKNYSGSVTTYDPIYDLERSVENSNSPVAYLFIIGKLSTAFRSELEARKIALAAKLGRSVSFEVVDEDRIAELYASFLTRSRTLSATTGGGTAGT